MIYVIIGPTCSGKTSAAIYLSDKKNAPIINGDAFQVYRGMDIGTSKISKLDKAYEKHYLLDIVEPDKTFSVMEYQKEARKVLGRLLKENNDIVIVGGTGLYIKALLYDYEFKEEEKQDIADLEAMNNEELHSLLELLDFDESKKIHVNNRKRLIRAISLIRTSDIKKSEMIANQKHEPIYSNIRFLFINPDRKTLYENIDKRVIEMMDNGLIDEVKLLLDKFNLSLTARQGIGYKEVISYLNNEINYDECVALIQKRTRNYAKRQVTFFKNQFPDIETFSSKEELISMINEL